MTPSTKTLCRSVTVLAGLAGFIGLLVAGHYLPAWSGPLRAGALAGFLGFGAIYTALSQQRRKLGSTPSNFQDVAAEASGQFRRDLEAEITDSSKLV